MSKLYVSTVIDAEISAVWKIIRNFDGLATWHPAVITSRIADRGSPDRVGCERIFTQRGGEIVQERLEALNDLEYSMTYSIVKANLPASDYVSTIRLYPITDTHRTLATWIVTFDCEVTERVRLCRELGELFLEGFTALKSILLPRELEKAS